MISILDNISTPSISSKTSDLVEKIFAPAGILQSELKLEHRPQQEAMALATAKAFEAHAPLLFEAGTGVGKSLAYLIPGIIHAVDNNRPFIVSTHTKALQEQIKNNDLPYCYKLFGSTPELEPYTHFKTALLMGRGNYLCTTRLAQAIGSRAELFPTQQQNELERIAEWATQTETGLIEELPSLPLAEVWDWVNADSSSCNKKNCSPTECFYQKAKAQLRQANLIIVNHSLLFTLLSAGMTPGDNTPGILFPQDFLVLDESHTVPEIATEHFGIRISSYALERTLKLLYNPRTQKGLLTKLGKNYDCGLVTYALAASEEFFNLIRQQFLTKKDTVRLHEPEWVAPIISESLRELIDALGTLAYAQQSEQATETLQDYRSRLQAYYNNINFCLLLKPSDHVHWLEKSGRRGQIVSINATPVDIAPYLQKAVFNQNTSALLTSATLASSCGMDNFQERIGAVEVDAIIEASPFDYENNCQIFIATDAPAPSKEDGRLNHQFLADSIQACSLKVEGGTLVLFTSYADMIAVAKILEPIFEKNNRSFFTQGRNLSRPQLKQALLDAGNGILFGTDSFWTGIDIPGPALSQVIITRLPFENPSHPIKEAQSEWLQAQGHHPFIHMTLPEAIIKFRQGIGRLIRNKQDRGIITILDSRILYKNYGKQFLQALPKKHFTKFDQESLEVLFTPT